MSTRSSVCGVCIIISNKITSRHILPKFNNSLSSPLCHYSTTTTTHLLAAASSFSLCSLDFKKSTHILRASSEGLPNEVDQESKFVPLNDEDPSYGPPAILLLGFGVEEADKIRQLMKDLEGDFLQVIYCTEDMMNGSLWDAVNSKQQSLEKLKIAKSVPRLCFLSGLTGEEMMMFIDAFEEIDIEPAVFAAHVPNSSNKPLLEVIEEVMGDHEMVVIRTRHKSMIFYEDGVKNGSFAPPGVPS